MASSSKALFFVLLLTVTVPAFAQVHRLWQEAHWEDAHAVAVQDTLAYVLTGWGFQILNIADPTSPSPVGSWRNLYGSPTAIAVSGGYACVADQGSNFWVIDVHDPTAPNQLYHSNQLYVPALAMAMSGNYVYAVGDNGFHVISVANPANPSIVVSSGSAGHGITLSGNFAYVADYSYRSLRVMNISDPVHPTRVVLVRLRGAIWALP